MLAAGKLNADSEEARMKLDEGFKSFKVKVGGNSKKTILLSPAAASFDQYKNFENRGIQFKKLIMKKFKRS